MCKYTCSMYNGLCYKGCIIYLNQDGIKIKMLIFNVLKLSSSEVVRIEVFKNSNIIKIVYNLGTKKDQIVDVRILRKKSFIKCISTLPWQVELKDKFEREISY